MVNSDLYKYSSRHRRIDRLMPSDTQHDILPRYSIAHPQLLADSLKVRSNAKPRSNEYPSAFVTISPGPGVQAKRRVPYVRGIFYLCRAQDDSLEISISSFGVTGAERTGHASRYVIDMYIDTSGNSQ